MGNPLPKIISARHFPTCQNQGSVAVTMNVKSRVELKHRHTTNHLEKNTVRVGSRKAIKDFILGSNLLLG